MSFGIDRQRDAVDAVCLGAIRRASENADGCFLCGEPWGYFAAPDKRDPTVCANCVRDKAMNFYR